MSQINPEQRRPCSHSKSTTHPPYLLNPPTALLTKYAVIKGTELIFESIPESILQASILMNSSAQDVTALSIFSVASSMLAAGILVTDLNLTMETSAMQRQHQQDPSVHPLYGYVRASIIGRKARPRVHDVHGMFEIGSNNHHNTFFLPSLSISPNHTTNYPPPPPCRPSSAPSSAPTSSSVRTRPVRFSRSVHCSSPNHGCGA